MDSLLTGLSQHGYSILFAIVFLEAIGIPVPCAELGIPVMPALDPRALDLVGR